MASPFDNKNQRYDIRSLIKTTLWLLIADNFLSIRYNCMPNHNF